MYGEKYKGQISSHTELGAHRKFCHYEAKCVRRTVRMDLQEAITSEFLNVATTEWDGLKLKIHPLEGKKGIPLNTMQNHLSSFEDKLESWNEVTTRNNQMFEYYTGSCVNKHGKRKRISNYEIRIDKMGINEMVKKATNDEDAKNLLMEINGAEVSIEEKKKKKMGWCLHIHIHKPPGICVTTMANLLARWSSKTTVHSWSEVTSACGTGDSASKLNWELRYKPPPESLPESSSSIRKNIILLNERLTTLEKKMMTSPDETVKTSEDKLENPDEGVKMLEDNVTSSYMQNNIIVLNEKVKNWRIGWVLWS